MDTKAKVRQVICKILEIEEEALDDEIPISESKTFNFDSIMGLGILTELHPYHELASACEAFLLITRDISIPDGREGNELFSGLLKQFFLLYYFVHKVGISPSDAESDIPVLQFSFQKTMSTLRANELLIG